MNFFVKNASCSVCGPVRITEGEKIFMKKRLRVIILLLVVVILLLTALTQQEGALLEVNDNKVVLTASFDFLFGNTVSSSVPASDLCAADDAFFLFQPESCTVAEGERLRFQVATAEEEAVTFQWQYRLPEEADRWIDSEAESAHSPVLSYVARKAFDGRPYRCVCTNQEGGEVDIPPGPAFGSMTK